ncbi:hypothetical protein NQ315_015261 [Exocentrus adspersus]|uniref:THAP-type domain-containing protein n=1 Tax=Exocentrus adspersus TaxID=1586481 RepID=A0AAV8VAP8_9CUCU|nr:hypothetical protein NQ315_015261 [Exocentrus adspersus]
MVTCSAFGCKSRSDHSKDNNGVTFHRFPLNEDRKNEWIKNMRLADWKPTIHCRLCSKHFEKQFFFKSGKRICLRKDAVPTLFPELPKYMQPEKLLKRKRVQETERLLEEGSAEPVSPEPDTVEPSVETLRLRHKVFLMTEKNKRKSRTIKMLEEKLKRYRDRITALKIAIKELKSDSLIICTEEAPVENITVEIIKESEEHSTMETEL